MTTEVMAELDEIVRLLEAKTAISVNSPAAKEIQKKFAQALSLYFRRLARGLPYDDIAMYVARYGKVKEATGDEAAIRIVSHSVDHATPELNFIISEYEYEAYKLGAEEAARVAKLRPPLDIIDDGADKWLRSHGAELVKQVDGTTKQRMANILVQGSHDGDSVQKIAKTMKSQLDNWSDIKIGTAKKGRALMIAQNELNQAMSESSLQTYNRLGVTGKSWSTALEPCEICLANEAEGVIPVAQSFSSGDAHPPAHPNCECTLTPERLDTGLHPSSVQEELNSFGEMHRTAGSEYCEVIDSKGNVLFSKHGAKDHIDFTPRDFESLKNADVFVHNHPRSTSFSLYDLRLAADANIKTMVVTSQKYTYTVTSTGTKFDYAKIKSAYAREKKNLWDEACGIAELEGQDPGAMWLYDKIWTNIQPWTGLKYTREAVI